MYSRKLLVYNAMYGILLTVLFRPHLAYVAASQEACNTNVFLTKRIQNNDLGLIIGVPGAKWCCTFLFVSTGILGVRGFGDRTNPPVFY